MVNGFLFFCQLSLPVLQESAILKLLLGSVGEKKRVYQAMFASVANQYKLFCYSPIAGNSSGPLALSSGDVFHFMAHVWLTMASSPNCGKT